MSGRTGAKSTARHQKKFAARLAKIVLPCGHMLANASTRRVGLLSIDTCGMCHAEHIHVKQENE